MNWTLLQGAVSSCKTCIGPSLHGIDIVERNELFVPAGNGRTSFIDARDAADVAAQALTAPDVHRDTVYHLTGSAALTMTEVADALTTVLGFAVTYTHPGLMRFATRLRGRGSVGMPSGSWPPCTR